MKTENTRKKISAWKSFFLAVAALSLVAAAPPLFAQGYGGQGQQQGQQGQQQGQQGQQQGQDYGGQGQQQGQDYQQPGSQEEETPDFGEEDLKKFAGAQDSVSEIRSEYSEELRNTEDSSKAQELQSKYQEKMVDAVEEEDLSIEKYNEIIQAMARDPELKEEIDGYRE
ncbi:MAG: DUF4168 domain-containing protein [Desulfosudaceae bacterium]